MRASTLYLELLSEALAPIGSVSARRMFGGAGIFSGGAMFALVADGVLYFKTDTAGSAAFKAEGLEPFTYERKAKPVALSFWRVPERLFDDPVEMRLWAERALSVARRSLAEKPQRRAVAPKAQKSASPPRPSRR